jgi:hypothetical protein
MHTSTFLTFFTKTNLLFLLIQELNGGVGVWYARGSNGLLQCSSRMRLGKGRQRKGRTSSGCCPSSSRSIPPVCTTYVSSWLILLNDSLSFLNMYKFARFGTNHKAIRGWTLCQSWLCRMGQRSNITRDPHALVICDFKSREDSLIHVSKCYRCIWNMECVVGLTKPLLAPCDVLGMTLLSYFSYETTAY